MQTAKFNRGLRRELEGFNDGLLCPYKPWLLWKE